MSAAGGRVEAVVALGANLGDRIRALRGAVARLEALPDTAVVACSAVYETEAHVLPGQAPQPDHLNAVVVVETGLGPLRLLRQLHAVERAAGRDAGAPRWSPRPLDLDLLLYGELEVQTPALTVPHPRLAMRRFVLAPLADVAAARRVPGLDRTVAELLAATPDAAAVRRTPLALR